MNNLYTLLYTKYKIDCLKLAKILLKISQNNLYTIVYTKFYFKIWDLAEKYSAGVFSLVWIVRKMHSLKSVWYCYLYGCFYQYIMVECSCSKLKLIISAYFANIRQNVGC